MKFTIHTAPKTKKNSNRIVKCKGRTIIIPSELYKQYEKDCRVFLPMDSMIDYPINVKALYYMPTRRRVDLCNLHECLCDVLVKHGVIVDDNSKIIVSMDGSRVFYDKENPRTEVEITRL